MVSGPGRANTRLNVEYRQEFLIVREKPNTVCGASKSMRRGVETFFYGEALPPRISFEGTPSTKLPFEGWLLWLFWSAFAIDLAEPMDLGSSPRAHVGEESPVN